MDLNFIAFQGNFILNFNQQSDNDEPLVNTVYEEPPSLIKSSKLLYTIKSETSMKMSQVRTSKDFECKLF